MPLGDTPLPVPSNIGFNHFSFSIYYKLCLTSITFPVHISYSCDPERGPGFSTSLLHIFPPACTGLNFYPGSHSYTAVNSST